VTDTEPIKLIDDVTAREGPGERIDVLCFGIVGFPRDSVLTSLRDVIRARWQSGMYWYRGYPKYVVCVKYKMEGTENV